MRAERAAQALLLGVEDAQRGLFLLSVRFKLRQFIKRTVQLVRFRFQVGDAAGAMVTARVALLFERGERIRAGRALLAGGDERGDAALKFGARVDAHAALADEGAALVDLARDTEQCFAKILGGETGNAFAAAGVDGGEAAHRVARAHGVARDGDIAHAASELQHALHRRERPGGVAVLFGGGAALAGREAIEHHAQKSEQRGLARLVRRLYDIETVFKLDRAMIERSKRRGHAAELQGDTPPE